MISSRILILTFFSVTALIAAPKKAAKEASAQASAEAARVAILLYEDKTGTKNFEYMPRSLKEAITKYMHEKFEFNEVDTKNVEPVADRIRKKAKGKIGPKEAAEICRATDVDILIFGAFTFNNQTNMIEIQTNISLGSTDKFRTLPAVQNKVDSTIFGAADRVATDIVAEITKIAKEQQEARGKAPAKQEQGRTQLARTEKRKTWADINWNISLTPIYDYYFISRSNASVNDKILPSAHAMLRVFRNVHAGLFWRFTEVVTVSMNLPFRARANLNVIAASAGYYFDFKPQWRATTAINLGYYFGIYDVSLNCPPGGSCPIQGITIPQTVIHNPYWGLRAGVHYLLFSHLALGLEAEYSSYYDSRILQSVGIALAVTGVF
ncbi:MAG: hypothetical protein N2Z22_00915 [Turneriella sp.]|nr:hypothetical protein [Turneriella sp.]